MLQPRKRTRRLHYILRYKEDSWRLLACLSSADLTAQNKDGKTLLHLALRDGQTRRPCHIGRSADLTVQDNYWETPFHGASRSGPLRTTGGRWRDYRTWRESDSPGQLWRDSITWLVTRGTTGGHWRAHRARPGFDSQEQGQGDSITCRVTRATTGRCWHAYLVRRGSDSPG